MPGDAYTSHSIRIKNKTREHRVPLYTPLLLALPTPARSIPVAAGMKDTTPKASSMRMLAPKWVDAASPGSTYEIGVLVVKLQLL